MQSSLKSIDKKLRNISGSNSEFARQYFTATLLDIGSQTGALNYEFIEKAARVAIEKSAYTHRIGSNRLKAIPQVIMTPAFLESATVALGRSGDYRAVPILIRIMFSGLPSGPAEAALCLANFKCRTTLLALLKALRNDDGWLRFAAYRTLKKLTGEDNYVDWIFGSEPELNKGFEKYKKAIKKQLEK